MRFDLWAFFVVTETALCLTPGPAVLFVVSHGLARGGAASLAANAGILSGNTIYFLLSALGLGAVLLSSHAVFTMFRYAGAVYLVAVGVKTFLGTGLSIDATEPAAHASGATRTWLGATTLQLANPKAIVFFAALLPQFVDPGRSFAVQILILGLTSLAIEFVVLAAYGYLAARASRLARQPRFRVLTNRVSGGLLVAAGAGVALTRAR